MYLMEGSEKDWKSVIEEEALRRKGYHEEGF